MTIALIVQPSALQGFGLLERQESRVGGLKIVPVWAGIHISPRCQS